MKFILGKKLKMSQIFTDKGDVVPVTLIEAGPCTITQIRSKEKDGYEAVQMGFLLKKKANKPCKGHTKDLGNFSYLAEYRPKNDKEEMPSEIVIGDKIGAGVFTEGDNVAISGVSKAKGFQGVVKRHGFGGGPASHGQKHSLREPGSIGSTWPQRVLAGKKMAGRMGGGRVTVGGLKIAKIDLENNIIAIKGAVPGKPGTILEIRGK